jgi:hypothetical protein
MQPDYQPCEDTYATVWLRVFTGPHRDCGGWSRQQGQPAMCACGVPLDEPVKAVA